MNKTQWMTKRQECIAEQFSQAAKTYDRASALQFERGMVLLEVLAALSNETSAQKPQRALDLGSATGKLTSALASRLGLIHVDGIDIAAGMIAHAKAFYSKGFVFNGDSHGGPPLPQGQIHYWHADITDQKMLQEKLPENILSQGYDIVFSNAVFHWLSGATGVHDLKALKRALSWSHDRLAKGGIFAFSLYLDGSYHELDALWGEGEPLRRLAFPPEEDVRAILKNLAMGKLLYEDISCVRLAFPNLQNFHRTQKLLGTQFPASSTPADTEQKMSVSQLRKKLKTFTRSSWAAELDCDVKKYTQEGHETSEDNTPPISITARIGSFIYAKQTH